jgi:hypothetical protein
MKGGWVPARKGAEIMRTMANVNGRMEEAPDRDDSILLEKGLKIL